MPDVLIELEVCGWTEGILTGNTHKRIEFKLSNSFKCFYSNLVFECKFGDSREGIAQRAYRFFKLDNINNVLVIGDTPRDIKVAKDFGFQVASVVTGRFTSKELEKFKPNLILKNFKDDLQHFLKFISGLDE